MPRGRRLKAAFIGDSFTFGALPYKEVFPNLVANLQGSRDEFPIINLSIASIGPKDYLRIAASRLPDLKPKFVVVTLYMGNDIHQSHPDLQTLLFFGQVKLLPDPWRFSVESYLWWAFSRFIKIVANWTQGDEFCTDMEEGPLLMRVFAFEEMAFAVKQSDYIRKSIDNLADIVGNIDSISRTHGVEPLFVLAPSRLQVDTVFRNMYLSCAGRNPASYNFRQPQQWVKNALLTKGVQVLNLLPAFLKARKDTFIMNDTHWNRFGNEVAAREIFQML